MDISCHCPAKDFSLSFIVAAAASCGLCGMSCEVPTCLWGIATEPSQAPGPRCPDAF